MPIALHQFTVAGAGQPGYYEALELARHCVEQYEFQVLTGPGGGIATGSCWAALAVQPNPGIGWQAPGAVHVAGGLGATLAGLPYSMVFGNSRMAYINSMVNVPGAPPNFSSHAERNALVAAGGNGLALHTLAAHANNSVLFVQLAPCGPCNAWLGGGGGGVPNPFAAAIGGATTLNVWYRFPYPGGVGAMNAWNGSTRAVKLADINANW